MGLSIDEYYIWYRGDSAVFVCGTMVEFLKEQAASERPDEFRILCCVGSGESDCKRIVSRVNRKISDN